ncbi:MAG: YbaB/EbfC family nucleoid-associated protein [Bacteroidales bacterium]|nr:YbaB/EbfC family nucleoid-associated protein [Bacteroidales bacterium]
MLGNLKEQIKEAQAEMKQKLEQMEIEGEVEQGLLKVVVNGNRKVLSIDVDAALYEQLNRDKLQDMIKQASNLALDKAEKIAEEEMMNSAKGVLPGMAGLFGG